MIVCSVMRIVIVLCSYPLLGTSGRHCDTTDQRGQHPLHREESGGGGGVGGAGAAGPTDESLGPGDEDGTGAEQESPRCTGQESESKRQSDEWLLNS